MKTKRLNFKQLKEAFKKHKYLILNETDGGVMAVNCGILETYTFKLKTVGKTGNSKTRIEGFQECGLMEYISNKVPFII